MPTKPLDRLMFAQGGLCFFCGEPLAKDDASVEHLVPSSRAGSNSDDNCVACCKSLNALLGSMTLKEKLRVVLLQKGDFQCPNIGASDEALPASPPLLALPAPADAPPAVAPIAKVEPVAVVPKASAAASVKTANGSASKDVLAAVLKDLKGRGKSKPLRVKTLASTIKALPLNLSDSAVQSVVDQLKASGKVVVTGAKVAYKL